MGVIVSMKPSATCEPGMLGVIKNSWYAIKPMRMCSEKCLGNSSVWKILG